MTDLWRHQAACAKTDKPSMFFSVDPHLIAQAKTICNGCPVRTECYAYAIDNKETDGIYGGLTPEERGHKYRRPSVCLQCGRDFKPKLREQICSADCQRARRRAQMRAVDETRPARKHRANA